MKSFLILITGDTLDDMEINLMEAWKDYRINIESHESGAIEGVLGFAGNLADSGSYEYQSTPHKYIADLFKDSK